MNNSNEIPRLERSYSEILKDIGLNARDLALNDFQLFISELKQIKKELIKEMRRVALSVVLLALSALPLLAFLTLILGQALGGQYALSALIVTGILSISGLVGLIVAFNKVKNIDLNFSKTRAAIKKESEAIHSKVANLQDIVRGERHA